MQFSSLLFLVFFAAVFALHRLPLSWTVRKWNLVAASCLFYAAWNPPFVLLLWASTLLDWTVGKHMHRAEGDRRRWLLAASLVGNLGMLGYFKYSGFVLENFALLLRSAGIEYTPPRLDIVLPIGISFYTFQTLSYSLDIYMRRAHPCASFLDYALSVSFFPQLVAGPIVRPRDFLPQCEKPHDATGNDLGTGLYLFVLGVFLKSVVADGLLAPHVETVFDGSTIPTTRELWLASAGWAGQIYADFAGYSMCAIGIGRCLGFTLPINFLFPLAAIGFQDFWRRWHISLSTWLRDYVYVPLQKRETGRGTHWIPSVLVTWLLIGLWHGAAWGFVLWGLWAGGLLIVERLLRGVIPPHPLWSVRPVQFGIAMLTFVGFFVATPLFRVPRGERMWTYLQAMFVGDDRATALLTTGDAAICATTVGALFLGNWFMRDQRLEDVITRTPWLLRALLLTVLVLFITLTREPDRAFIYFQF